MVDTCIPSNIFVIINNCWFMQNYIFGLLLLLMMLFGVLLVYVVVVVIIGGLKTFHSKKSAEKNYYALDCF